MSKVYLPSFTSSNCIVILDKDTIRVYDNLPSSTGISYTFTDYYINSHYLKKTGSEVLDLIPSCETQTNFTTDVYYRNDFADILFIVFVFFIFVIYMPYRIISRAFGRWLKV